MKTAKELYPNEEEGWSITGNYQPIINELCKSVVVQIEEDGYQGDTWVLFENYSHKYGYLQFGWGSCSGCDALQACDTFAEIDELIKELNESITHFDSREDALKYFKTHDWEGDYGWYEPEKKRFVAMCVAYLEDYE